MKRLEELVLYANSLTATWWAFIFLSIWWIIIYLLGTTDALANHAFGFIYGGFSIWGGICGLFAARQWGGRGSLMGRALMAIALGLLLQAFGQYTFWIYNYILRIPVPYPSLADIGFFGTIPCYIYATILLARASGVSVSLRLFFNQIHALIIPLVTVMVSYMLFFRQYEVDLSDPLKLFFDLGYPFGQATYIAIAILTYSLSRGLLGGVMKNKILLLLIAFFAQYAADYIFIYFHELYFPASFIDFVYLTAYALMTVGILNIGKTALRLRSG